jgi:CubicO group peptidase (beta-lactamase class C family)
MDLTPPARDELEQRLDALARKHGVPGAAAGVMVGDEVTVCATGVTRDDAEGVPIGVDTLFLVGSITKVWTATLVMQLVDEGLVELDDRVNSHLDPPLRLAGQGVADAVTIRQLLTHTAGFYGDREDPPERGDDALRRAVASYADLPQLHRPGQLFSYNNAGYNVLGRLVECLTGSTWDDALRERVLDPLGLQRTFTLPEQAMVHPVAVGHDLDLAEKTQQPVTLWCDSRASGPCGGTLAMRAADLLAFAKMHLRDGQRPDGNRVLSAQSARLMREPQVSMVDPVMGLAWGLGWEIGRLDEPVVVGHGGNTNGQMSQLFLVPDHDVAICVLTNGDATGQLRETLCDELLSELVGVTVSQHAEPAADGTHVDLMPFVGTFGRDDVRFTFRAAGGVLEADVGTSGRVAESLDSFTTALSYASDSRFLLVLPGLEDVPQPITFVREDGDDGPATHLAMSGRVLPRLPSDTEGEPR